MVECLSVCVSPYSRDFVVSSVSRHFWKRLEGWYVGTLSECLFVGHKSDHF